MRDQALSARILIVDDQDNNVVVLQRMLERRYSSIRAVTDARQALSAVADFVPDIVLLDLHMPHVSGFTILEQLRREHDGEFLPVVVLTADATRDARNLALGLGANDFLTKPLDRAEVELRVGNLLETRALHHELKVRNVGLEARVRERTLELEQANIDSLNRLALAAEFRDDDTGEHTRRVGDLTETLAQLVGWSVTDAQMLGQAAALHDVGKIAVPDAVLLKPGKLTTEEFEVVKTHTNAGARILEGSTSELLKLAETIALTHHERWDGGGYPNGLAGDEIPVAGRLVAVADVFDSLTHRRVYKPAWDRDRALAAIAEESGTHFDPLVASVFLDLQQESRAA